MTMTTARGIGAMRHRVPSLCRVATRAVLGTLLISSAVRVSAQEPIPGLDAYVANAVKTWNVPGLSIAVVGNDSVIFAKGYGVLSASSDKAVNENTLFEIGSSSKAFTATVVAMLVSEGKMRWDERATTYLPSFRLNDPVANAEITIRDLLTHRSGVGRAELIWIGSGVGRDEVLRRIAFVKPESPFRSRYSYQNVMFLAAGEAAGKAAGSSWDALVKERIFTPLGMTRSLTSSKGLTDPNAAEPHGSVRDSVFVKPHLPMENIGPAGSILSSARDMAQWLRFQLGDGMYQGKRLLEPAPFRETHTPQILMAGGGGGRGGGGGGERVTNFNTYGLGWIVHDYRSALVWEHGGNTDGMTAAVGMLPDHKLGVVVLANMNSSALPGLLMRWVFDRQLNQPQNDLVGEALTRSRTQRVRADSIAARTPRRTTPPGPPPVPLTAFTGSYFDDVYGEATITLANNTLTLKRGDWVGPLAYSSGTSFRWTVPFQPVGQPEFIRFEITPDDRVTGFYFGFGEFIWLMRKRGGGAAAGPGL